MTGKTLLHYEVLEKLGEGGMGVVYKARDTALGRMVAIKVLPEKFTEDPERTARFRREAHALASLSHPNIAAVYGLEEAEGRKFLVMELAEGETLARRIGRGRMRLKEALEIARQIAEGVEEAHEKGILHRDLKPANVMVSEEGRAKILDFGLAKIFGAETPVAVDTQMPTATASVSHPGVILGTVAYMSPEQARGRPVGRRADIWAFGCVLFEMLTGEKAFQGETITDTLAKILEGQPRWEALPADLPGRARELLESCLRQDPQERLHDVGDARLEIRKILAGERKGRPPRKAFWAWVSAALVAGMVLGVVGTRVWRKTPAAGTAMVVHTEIDLGKNPGIALEGGAALTGIDSPLIEVSPDGGTVVYVGAVEGGTQLFARNLGNPEVKPIAGTQGAIHPFFSPDGKSIGFLTSDSVKTVPLGGGEPVTLSKASDAVVGTWASDGNIYFTETQGRTVARVPAEGGQATPVIKYRPEYRYGRAMPDGKHVFSVYQPRGISADSAEVRLVPVAGGPDKVLVANGYDGRFVAPGTLIFGRAGELYAVAFDPNRLTVGGKPRRVASGVRMNALFPHVQAGASGNGIIAYLPGGDAARGIPAWLDRNGKIEFTSLEERVYGALGLSSDGRRLAIHVAEVNDYVLIYDFGSDRRRTIKGPVGAGWPTPAPKGDAAGYLQYLAEGGYELVYQRLDAERPPAVLRRSPERMFPTTWTADGGLIGGYEWPSRKLFLVPVPDGKAMGQPQELSYRGGSPTISADGHWLAVSELGGSVALRPLEGERSYQITSERAMEPLWCARTSELYYRQGNRWFSTKVKLEPSVEWEKPRQAFETEFIDTPGMSYALSPDGQRMLVVKRVREMPRNKIVVLQNWTAAGAK